jgi:hypothetical protein
MIDQSSEMNYGTTLYCLEVLEAVQTDSRTSGWYLGDVRGKAGVALATTALRRKDLICPHVGSSPFRLTIKGEEFLKTHETSWNAFLANADRTATINHFMEALIQLPEEQEARDSQ